MLRAGGAISTRNARAATSSNQLGVRSKTQSVSIMDTKERREGVPKETK